MAVTTLQLETLIAAPAPNPFLERVEMAMTVIAENVSSEAGGTALHAQRKALAAQIMNSPNSDLVYKVAAGIIAQLPQSSTSLVTVNGVANADVDTTDATLQTTFSAVYNDYFV